MRILQLNSGREINGAVIHTYLLTQQLVRLGHHVSVICRPGSWLVPKLAELGVSYLESTMDRRVSELRRVAEFAKRESTEVFHTHMSRAHMFGLLLRTSTGIPCVATAHHRLFQLHWWLNDFVIANSEATRSFHIRYNRVSPHRIKTVYCASDLQQFSSVAPELRQSIRQRYRLLPDQPLIGAVGEVVQRKGHIHLLRALPRILAARPDARVMLVGDFDRKKKEVRAIRHFLARNELYRKVFWAGKQQHVPGYMSAMDICVVPSLEEPLGLVAMEAQAAGLPVIASSTGGLTEIVSHEQSGLLVSRGDADAIAGSVLRLLDNPAWAAELAARGQRQATANFSLPRLTEQVAAILHDVREDRGGRRGELWICGTEH